MPKVSVGFALYGDATFPYLPYFLDSLIHQKEITEENIWAIDNSPQQDSRNRDFLKKHYPKVNLILASKNLGFARAQNIMIRKALASGADYFLATNVDMVYEPNVVSFLTEALEKDSSAAVATGKVRRWDFSQKHNAEAGKTNYLDTAGIAVTKEHRFFDRGQGEIDYGQYDQEEEIFGASGALALYRLSALEDVAFINEKGEKEYFDELMFMYKEDCDLAYRLQLAGYKCLYIPQAIVYHDRSLASCGQGLVGIIKGRLGKKRKYKEWSWLNHHIILRKIINKDYPWDIKWRVWWYEIKSNGYALLFEPYLIKQWWKLFKLRNAIRKRSEQLKKRVKLKQHLNKLMK